MSTEAPAYRGITAPSSAARPSLPSVGTYLNAVVALGVGSLRPSLPLLAFIYFYQLGTQLYLAFSMEASEVRIGQMLIMHGIAALPLFAVEAPLYPLQDAMLRGNPRSFSHSARAALGRAIPLLLSLLIQTIILFGPPLLLLGGVGLMVRSLPSIPGAEVASYGRAAMFLALVPCVVYWLVTATLLRLATPALLVDSRGPLSSVRVSISLVASRFGGVLGRLLAFGLVGALAMIVVSLPITFLEVVMELGGSAHPVMKVASVIWQAAVGSLIYPFSVAAALILYRSLRPAGSVEAPDGTLPPGTPAEAPRATSPFQFE